MLLLCYGMIAILPVHEMLL